MTAHLYSVDSTGTTTPPGPGDPSADRPQRSKPKARPRRIVPTDRLKFSKQREALCAVAILSRNGEEVVTGEAMASVMEVAPSTAPLNNAFFIDVGLMVKVGKGGYKPTDLALKFQQEFSFDPDNAGPVLAPALTGTWFHQAVQSKLAMVREPVPVDAVVRALAGAAGTDSSYSAQYLSLLHWLEFAGLISIRDDAVLQSSVTPAASIDGDQLAEDEEKVEDVNRSSGQSGTQPQSRVIGVPPVISLSFDVTISAEDLARLRPEQITELFDGVGKVAALQASLRQEQP